MHISSMMILGALAAAVPHAAKAEPPAPTGEQIAACMQSAAISLGFGGTVHASRGGLTIERSFGTSDAGGRIPNASRTRFNTGSATKMFTALAIGRLVDRGVLHFDAPVMHYLPDVKPEFASITVAELLDHTAGLGDYFRPENEAAIEAAKTATALLPLALAAPPAFKPGARRAYSNSGYIVLGAVIEKVSGETWAAFIQKEILDPAGMTDTRLDSMGGATPMSRVSPRGRLNKPRPAPGPVLASPAGGIFSTPSDLSRLLTAVFDGHLVSQATLAVLLTPRADPAGGSATVGYGFVIREKPTVRIGIGGGAPGVNADISVFPETGWRLVALSNLDPPVATLLDRVLERAVSSKDAPAACAAALAGPNPPTPPGDAIAPRGFQGAPAGPRR